jgi:hypothetical protein
MQFCFSNFFLAFSYFNEHIFCSNVPKKARKSQEKFRKARQDLKTPEKMPKTN